MIISNGGRRLLLITVSMPPGVEHQLESNQSEPGHPLITVSMPPGVEHLASEELARVRAGLITVSMPPGVEHVSVAHRIVRGNLV